MTDFSFDFSVLTSSPNEDVSAYEAQLAQQLQRVTQSALRQWAKDSENAFQAALKTAIAEAIQTLTKELASSIAKGGVESAGGLTGSLGGFSKAITQLVSSTVSELLAPTRIRTSTRETERSHQAQANALRLSDSQREAQQARNALRAQRNL